MVNRWLTVEDLLMLSILLERHSVVSKSILSLLGQRPAEVYLTYRELVIVVYRLTRGSGRREGERRKAAEHWCSIVGMSRGLGEWNTVVL